MGDDAAQKARDKLLDDLTAAAKEVKEKVLKSIQVQEDLYNDVLKAQGSATKLAQANAQRSKLLLINDISTFLTG